VTYIRHVRAIDVVFPGFPSWPPFSVTVHPLATGVCPIRRRNKDISGYALEMTPWRFDAEHDLHNQWNLVYGERWWGSAPVIEGRRETASAGRVGNYRGD
jgi:hypothetical protein